MQRAVPPPHLATPSRSAPVTDGGGWRTAVDRWSMAVLAGGIVAVGLQPWVFSGSTGYGSFAVARLARDLGASGIVVGLATAWVAVPLLAALVLVATLAGLPRGTAAVAIGLGALTVGAAVAVTRVGSTTPVRATLAPLEAMALAILLLAVSVRALVRARRGATAAA